MNWNRVSSPKSSTPNGPTSLQFPSTHHVPIEWDKLASVDLHDLNSGQCNVEVLQEHLNHVAFCRLEELKLGNSSGQRTMLKMFRLAQLIIQYLFISQEYIESQMTQAHQEHELMDQKYQQMKTNFQKQVDEAKKMKKSNKNLRDSITYLNSLLSSVGALEHYRCPICPKAFRSQDFLLSHIRRKHPAQAASVDTSKCIVRNGTAANPTNVAISSVKDERQQIAADTTTERGSKGLKKQKHLNEDMLSPQTDVRIQSDDVLNNHNKVTKGNFSFFDEPPNDNGYKDASISNLHLGTKESCSYPQTPKDNDIDSYRGKEIFSKFDMMNNLIMKLSRDIEWQKLEMKEEREKRMEEARKADMEKRRMQETYEKTLQDLNEKLISLQVGNEDSNEKLTIQDILDKQQQQIEYLSLQLNNQFREKLPNEKFTSEKSPNEYNETEKQMKQEINELKCHLNTVSENQTEALQKLKTTLSKNNEKRLKKERDISNKEIESLKRKLELVSTPPTNITQSRAQHDRNTETKLQPNMVKSTQMMYGQQIESSDSETEMSQWFHDTEKRDGITRKDDVVRVITNTYDDHDRKKTLPSNDRGSITVTSSYEDDNGLPDSPEESGSDDETQSVRHHVTLKFLLDANPRLWAQMRDVIATELDKKTKAIVGENIKNKMTVRELNKCKSKLRLNRQSLAEKYEGFYKLRKALENAVDIEVDKNGNKVESSSPHEVRRKSSTEVFRERIKKMQSQMQTKSKQITSTFRKKHQPEQNPQSATKVVQIMDKNQTEHSVSFHSRLSSNEINETTESFDNRSADKMEVDVYGERVQSVRRNLFSSSPLSASPNPLPRRQSLFENKIYGNISPQPSDSETDSDHDYINLKSEAPEKNSNNVISLEKISEETGSNEETNLKNNSEIKLKKPTGAKIQELTSVIEKQMKFRSQQKPAGGVDILTQSSSSATAIKGNKNNDIQELDSFDSDS